MVTDFYEIKTAATEQPVTLVEVKAWCKITHTTEDDMITALIVSATEKAEKYTNRVFVTRTFTGYLSGLDWSCRYEVGPYIELRRAPLGSVTTVKVTEDDSLETVSSDDYNVKETGGFPRIVFEEINDQPDRIPYPYQVEFTAGYGAAAAVPGAIKTAIMETVCYWHQNRGDCGCGNELPGVAMGILGEYKIINTFA
jgi:uncharacterized phiE125 gp8 family phage protein